ncbi:hypothetical protein GA0074692_4246 [Micromonospora pallida]|uniref:Uncharacterized protein n=1 Tax=Micromonospora pallida TaxID=145854 RepID=A0A1C6T332_9ACTN|nr:hypothetical protein [Micromonospora pallida]SCL36029.1 hypothetical protein GA0074692_4246 [Micromonospora pallida]
MGYRQKTTKSSVALWMLVALGDAVLLLASVGISALIALVSVVTIVAAVVGGRLVLRRSASAQGRVPAADGVSVTRRREA